MQMRAISKVSGTAKMTTLQLLVVRQDTSYTKAQAGNHTEEAVTRHLRGHYTILTITYYVPSFYLLQCYSYVFQVISIKATKHNRLMYIFVLIRNRKGYNLSNCLTRDAKRVAAIARHNKPCCVAHVSIDRLHYHPSKYFNINSRRNSVACYGS